MFAGPARWVASTEFRFGTYWEYNQVAMLLASAGFIVLASFISPYELDRRDARQSHQQSGTGFIEVQRPPLSLRYVLRALSRFS